MDKLEIARWQFGTTTVYHFLMVPLTIGLSILVAGMQTAWLRTGKEKCLAMTKFWGKLLMINFAMGVVTGIVQEFQFGLNWSSYSKFVGDIFGAPLAMEGIVAFFIESTFLGLWIFGWDKLAPKIHLACAWAFSLATIGSAYFIIAANSWMQHPVGAKFVNGKPQLTSIWAVLGNNTAVWAFLHAIAGAFAVAGSFLVGIAIWQLARKKRSERADDPAREQDRPTWRASIKLGGILSLVAFAALLLTGDSQGKLMFQQQPMKMAAAEALCTTEAPASFSIIAIGDVARSDCESVKSFTVPALLSFLAHNDFSTEVKGVGDLVGQYEAKYGTHYPNDPALGQYAGKPIDYVPNLPVTYWGFRLMIGLGGLGVLVSLAALWLTRKGRYPRGFIGKWLPPVALLAIATPFLANSFGWIFTEMGRQPFVVAPNPTGVDGMFMYTAQAVSPGVTAGEMLFSLIALASVYLVLGVVEVFLITRYVRAGIPGVLPPKEDEDSDSDELAFAY
ncbi:cytochrome ubiquinol oxidase subunit I [Sciscionella sediminilitoris]|uniref:cytochrome ubiquinol oxidase subunit I n=1 Tax=Sciscionella sediminilitoris TaxID=1445613 RepID=UPI0004DEDFD4|nr:cytochrome ubiquinol oxidase subunit I [Sciscionella sp. SE31]